MVLENVPCALCGQSEAEIVFRKFGLFISRCTYCGLVFANPRLPREDIAKRYSADYFYGEYLPAQGVRDGKYDLAFFDRRYAPILHLIAHAIQPPGTLFEVGVGAGFFLKAAERAGWKVSGIEFSAEAAQFATAELGLEVKRERAELMILDAGCFDVVVMFDVLEHLSDPLGVLASVRQALRPGGLAVISTPNLNALSKFFLGSDWAVLSPAEHLYYFTEATLTRALQKAGYQKLEFIRHHPTAGARETMNAFYTHAPHSAKTMLYCSLVALLGPHVYRRVQALGKGDALLCLAEAS
jgi:SAM-dependent methyltransferase